jgi:zinc transporter 2
MDADQKSYVIAMKKLKLVSFVSIFFIACQLVGGYLANSIAIFTDTAHLSSDMIGFGMSMIALKLSMRPASKELTFGWHRAEIIGTMISIIFLLTMTLWLLYEAVHRLVDSQEVKGKEMLITAVLGLFFNLIQMKILHQGEGHYHLGGSHSHDHDHEHGGCSHEGGDIETHKCNNHIH